MTKKRYLDDDVELLGNGGVDRANLFNRAGALVDFEKLLVIGWIAAEKGVADRRVDAVHIDGLDLLGRDVKNAR